MLRLVMKPEYATYKPIENDIRGIGGFILDTAGIQIKVRSYLWGATIKHPTSDFVLILEIRSNQQFFFPLSKCVLTDSTAWKRRPAGVRFNNDRIKDDYLFNANENIEVGLGINDGVLLIYPSKLFLPPIIFSSSKDSVHLPKIIIEGPVGENK